MSKVLKSLKYINFSSTQLIPYSSNMTLVTFHCPEKMSIFVMHFVNFVMFKNADHFFIIIKMA